MRQSFFCTTIGLVLIGFCSTPVFADNIADSRTTGEQNVSTIDQAGDDISSASEAFVIQSGDGNRSEVEQGRATGRRQHGFRSADVTQTGNGNLSSVVQDGPSNAADIEQIGDRNEADVQQDSIDFSEDNEARRIQLGDDNLATFAQCCGAGLAGKRGPGFRKASVTQTGDDNLSRVEQIGPFNEANIDQIGDGNEADVFQEGLFDALGNAATIFQSGTGNRTNIRQNSGLATGKR